MLRDGNDLERGLDGLRIAVARLLLPRVAVVGGLDVLLTEASVTSGGSDTRGRVRLHLRRRAAPSRTTARPRRRRSARLTAPA